MGRKKRLEQSPFDQLFRIKRHPFNSALFVKSLHHGTGGSIKEIRNTRFCSVGDYYTGGAISSVRGIRTGIDPGNGRCRG